MTEAQHRIKDLLTDKKDIRKESPELYYLSGITKPIAIIIDSQSKDWILLGERNPEFGSLTLDNWVVALRARFKYPNEDPGVTIDPILRTDCGELSSQASCPYSDTQRVKYFGGIENTHFGQVTFDADWLMKKISFGLHPTGIDSFKDHFSFEKKQIDNPAIKSKIISSRLWIYPIVSRVNVHENLIFMEDIRLGVFTEVLYAEINGRPINDLVNFTDKFSALFAKEFSEHYVELAKLHPPFDLLRGLTRLAALAKGFRHVNQRPNIDYFLYDYPIKKSNTPLEVKLLRVQKRSTSNPFELSGGAELMALIMRLKEGDANALPELVIKSRPSIGTLVWSFNLQSNNEQATTYFPKKTSTQESDITEMYLHSIFLIRKRMYREAIGILTQILQISPELMDGLIARGLANRLIGNIELAKSDYQEALKIDPTFAATYINLGRLFMGEGNLYESKRLFKKAIELSPQLSQPYNNLGIVFRVEGKLLDAVSQYKHAISLSPKDPIPQFNLGLALLQLKKYQAAIGVIEQIKNVNSEVLMPCQFYLASAYFQLGNLNKALEKFRQFIELTSTEFDERKKVYFSNTGVNEAVAKTDGNINRLRELAFQYISYLELELDLPVSQWMDKSRKIDFFGKKLREVKFNPRKDWKQNERGINEVLMSH